MPKKVQANTPPNKTKAGRFSRCVIDAKSRMLVSTLRDYFAKERDTLAPGFDPDDPIGRTACALKLDVDTVKAIVTGKYIVNEENSDSDSDDNDEETKITETTGWPEVDCFKIEAIRQVIRSYLMNSEVITRTKFKRALKKNNLMPQTKSLSCVLSHMGFYWRECLTQQILLERDDFVTRRCKFLRRMESVNFKDVIWLGETCIYSTCVNKVPYNPRKRSTISKGGRVIVMHAGSSKGWVEGAKQMYISKKVHSFYEDIGTKAFLEWFERLLVLIPSNSVIVMEDNFCHAEELNKPPKEHNTREEILDWLGRHNVWIKDNAIEFSKAELLGIVSETKPFYPTYAADEMAFRYGHTVERLPPFHSHFNPIEKIFQRIQLLVEKRADACGGLSLKDIETQTQVALSSIKPKDWSEAVTQAANLHTKYREQEPKLQEAVETVISNILKLKKNGRAYITKEGNIENQAVSENSDDEYESTHSKKIRVTDPDPEEMKRLLQNAAVAKTDETQEGKKSIKDVSKTAKIIISRKLAKINNKGKQLIPIAAKDVARKVNISQSSSRQNIIKLPANQIINCGTANISTTPRFILPKDVKIFSGIPLTTSNSGTMYKLVNGGTTLLSVTPQVFTQQLSSHSLDMANYLETVVTENGRSSQTAESDNVMEEVERVAPSDDMGIFTVQVESEEESLSDTPS